MSFKLKSAWDATDLAAFSLKRNSRRILNMRDSSSRMHENMCLTSRRSLFAWVRKSQLCRYVLVSYSINSAALNCLCQRPVTKKLNKDFGKNKPLSAALTLNWSPLKKSSRLAKPLYQTAKLRLRNSIIASRFYRRRRLQPRIGLSHTRNNTNGSSMTNSA